MKILSILAVLCALASLLGFAVNWSLNSFDSFEKYWEEDWYQTVGELTWLINDGGAGFAILLLGIGMAIQSFKKKDPTQSTT